MDLVSPNPVEILHRRKVKAEQPIQILKRRRGDHLTTFFKPASAIKIILRHYSLPLSTALSTALHRGGLLSGETLNDGLEVGNIGLNMVALNYHHPHFPRPLLRIICHFLLLSLLCFCASASASASISMCIIYKAKMS